jgi:L-seryl-tRNA(Ser) seleniumtransferase
MDSSSKVGGGALPLQNLPTKVIAMRLDSLSVDDLEGRFRNYSPPIIGHIERDWFLLDVRTICEEDFPIIEEAVRHICSL